MMGLILYILSFKMLICYGLLFSNFDPRLLNYIRISSGTFNLTVHHSFIFIKLKHKAI